jgi:hypothetical protein
VSTTIPLLVIVALVAAIALCGVGIWAAIELAKTARSSRRLADDLDQRVPPLVDKLDVSVDAFNAELLRVDLMVDQLEGAVNRFSGTAETVREVVDAPIHLVNEVAERVRHGFRRRGSQARRGAHPQPPSGEPPAEVVLLDTGADAGEEATSAAAATVFEDDDTPSIIRDQTEPVVDIESDAHESDTGESEATGGTESSDSGASDSATSNEHEPEEA